MDGRQLALGGQVCAGWRELGGGGDVCVGGGRVDRCVLSRGRRGGGGGGGGV